MTTNPLLTPYKDRPQFSIIKPEYIAEALRVALAQHKIIVEQVLQNIDQPSWQSLVVPLDEANDQLSKMWSPIRHVNSVCSNPELRKAHDLGRQQITEYFTQLKQDENLYQAYKNFAQSEQYSTLNGIQQKIINDELNEFKLGGIALDSERREQFAQLKKQLSQLASQFSNNVLDANMAWSYNTENAEELKGLPDYALEQAKLVAKNNEQAGFTLNLEIPCYLAVMTFCANRQIRQQMYQAYCTRASDQFAPNTALDNTDTMQTILKLRHQQAKLLGFNNYAELSLAQKMATSTEQVLEFLHELIDKTKTMAMNELAELRAFAEKTDGITDLQAFDISYYSEKLKQQDHAISQEELRAYFPLAKVLEGLFAIVNRLFSIDIEEVAEFDRWHDDVRLFRISKNGALVGEFYLDLYARAHKQGGAWMDDCQGRMKQGEKVQKPIAYLTCNFTPPVNQQPSLLTHNEVVTLFHEFGHGLHHMLTQIDYLAVSGINGVEWDAVELPSQFMENFCWQKESLSLMSEHHDTQQPLPDVLLERLLGSKNFQSGMQMMRQLEFALFDFSLHTYYQPGNSQYLQQTLDKVRAKAALYEYPQYNRFAHGFSHIFAGGYAAGYYSYKWAEVLSADAFSVFESEGVLNQQAGQAFLDKILSKGGSKKALELFRDFMGRAPSVDALLRHSGITANSAT